jgi:tRNA(Ile)-lysidine synthetase-like protein
MKHTCKIPNKITICVSGGVDSVAAAYLLSKHRGKDIQLYHFNHRTKQADIMEEKVREFAEFLNKPLIVKRAETELRTESEFRAARFKYFETGEYRDVVTAHHLGDCIESYLMNCFKGHNDWKVPIRPTSLHENFAILHPFLLFTKDNFKHHCVKNNLMRFACEDETNEQNICRRNFIRNTIVPLLNQENIFIEKVVRKQYLKYINE